MRPFSEKERKLILSLHQKKRRDEHRLFLAEGEKVIGQMLPFFQLEYLLSTAEVLPSSWISAGRVPSEVCRSLSPSQMRKLSLLETPTPYLAIFRQPSVPSLTKHSGLAIALERIQDPGNLGTIIRLADWMGVRHLLLSPFSVDPYGPKVVQATAGALGNVVIHTDLELKETLPRYYSHMIGTTLGGKDVRYFKLPTGVAMEETILLFGNEGQGLSEELLSMCHDRVTIPPASTTISESLNIAMSVAILLTHFRN